LRGGKSFQAAADQFLREYEALTIGERNPKERHCLDPVVMPQVQEQRRSPATPCPGLQSGQLHAHAGLPEAVSHWSLTSLRERSVKIGDRIVGHGRYVTFQIAEVAVPRGLFRRILEMISDLRGRQAVRC